MMTFSNMNKRLVVQVTLKFELFVDYRITCSETEDVLKIKIKKSDARLV